MPKRFSFPIFRVLLLLGFGAWASTNAALASSASDAAFLRSLAESELQAPAQDAPLAGVGTPAPSNTTCSISRPCGDGNTASCTGTYACTYSQRGVTCNSTEYPCPGYCTMSWTCVDCPERVHTCSSLREDCGDTAEGCDGRQQLCKCPLSPDYP